MRRIVLAALLAVLPLSSSWAAGPQVLRPRPSGVQVGGQIAGHGVRDYVFDGRAGQEARITLTGGAAAYFLLWQPSDEQMTVVETRDWLGTLPSNGRYVLRVFLYRSHAERGDKASYTLKVRLGRAAARRG